MKTNYPTLKDATLKQFLATIPVSLNIQIICTLNQLHFLWITFPMDHSPQMQKILCIALISKTENTLMCVRVKRSH